MGTMWAEFHTAAVMRTTPGTHQRVPPPPSASLDPEALLCCRLLDFAAADSDSPLPQLYTVLVRADANPIIFASTQDLRLKGH